MGYNTTAPDEQDCTCYSGKTTLEIIYELKQAGRLDGGPQKPRRARQSATDVSRIIESGENALAVLSAVEAEAGPSASKKLTEAKRFQAAYSTGKERDRVRLELLGQRNGLLRILTVQEGVNVIVGTNDRVLAFLDILLDLSANVAALTGSKWTATQTWIARNLPTALSDIGPARLKMQFDSKVAKAARALASGSDLRTAPSVTHIAHELDITTHHLRVAQANRVGLTSIDKTDAKTRWKERDRVKRRERGCRPQTEMTTRAEDIRLASLVGCTDRTIRTHRLKGDLATWLASKGLDFPQNSLPKDIYVESSLGSSPQASEAPDLNDVFVFRDADMEPIDADGIVPKHTSVPSFQDEKDCPFSAARSDG